MKMLLFLIFAASSALTSIAQGPIVRARLEDQVVNACAGEVFEELVTRVRTRELDPHAAAAELLAHG